MKAHILLATSLVLVLTLFGAGLVQPTASHPLSMPQASQPDSLVFTLKVPALQTNPDGEGIAPPSLEGYQAAGAPGDPLLPVKAYNIALPPDVIPESVQAQVIDAKTVELEASAPVAPAPPGVMWVQERQVEQWGKNAASIVDGKNTLVYQNDAYFPQSQLSNVRFDQMRKWRYVTLLLAPLQYNPVAGKLRLASEVQVQVTFERAASVDQNQLQIELSDTMMDERAAQLLYNVDQARAWYPVMAKPDGLSTPANYVILTSKNIVTASKKLNSFVAHKQAQGYSVLVVTEDQYGTTQYPSTRADKIRQWLKNNYQALSIEYVLLIGDPKPYNPKFIFDTIGDVPMFMCWPMHLNLADPGESIPTDYPYANLTGNWNLNQLGQFDQYCGELTDDDGPGGMSFQPDVYVGRIPVYQNVPGWVDTLDSILNKTILYEDSGDMDWRKRALLPMSFSDSTTDGAYLGEAMKGGYLNSASYDVFSLYQHAGSGCYSTFGSSQDLVDLAVANYWKNHGFGIVTWHAHGGSTSTGIGYGSCGSGNVLTAGDANLLDDSHPAIVFSASCYNGWPENPGNLGYSLLKQGAITVVSSSRMSGYYHGSFSPNRSAAGNADMAYYITQRMVDGETASHALYDEKYQMSQVTGWNPVSIVNSLDFNLYGDPSLSINDGKPWAPSAPNWLMASSNATTGIDLTWNDNSDNEYGFVIERKADGDPDWTEAGSVGINGTSWSDSGLSCGSHYLYRVQARNAYGVSLYSNHADGWSLVRDEFENDDTYLNAKYIITSGFAANGQTHNFHIAGDVDWIKFNATWGKLYDIEAIGQVSGNDTYLELYDSTGSLPLQSNDDCTLGHPDSGSCLMDWVATATGVFYVKVSNAQTQGGCYDYEYHLSVLEGGFASWPSQPTNLTATPISHCQVDLAWTSTSIFEQGFEIERFGWKGTKGGLGTVLWQKLATVGSGVTHYHDTGLECNKSYPYRVRAYNANGKSYYSDPANAVTLTSDAYEADNSYLTASPISTNGTPQEHNFSVAGDQDWVKFTASAGQVYTITTSSLGSANDTVLELYASNHTTRLEWNDDCLGLAACIKKWTPPSSGTYYVRVKNFFGDGGCPDYQYTLSVTKSNSPTSLLGPSGLYFSDWTVNTLLLAWPDANASTTPHAYQVERWHVITGTVGQWRQIGISGPGWSSRSGPEGAGSAMPNDGNAAFRDSWLTCNTTYDYRIRAFDALGDSAYSEVISATTPLTDTSEPDNDYSQAHSLSVNTLNSSLQNFNLGAGLDTDWTKFTATAGEVYTITTSQFTHSDNLTPTLALYDDPPTGPLETTQRCGADSRSLCINGWSPRLSGTYYLRVSGQGGCPGHDYFLSVVDSHLSDLWPAPPSVFTGTLTLPDQIDLTWTDTTPIDHQGFRLERRLGTGWLQVAQLGFNVTSYSDAGLACGQPYQYRLFAYNDSGDSAYATLDEISTPACVYPLTGYPLFLPIVRR